MPPNRHYVGKVTSVAQQRRRPCYCSTSQWTRTGSRSRALFLRGLANLLSEDSAAHRAAGNSEPQPRFLREVRMNTLWAPGRIRTHAPASGADDFSGERPGHEHDRFRLAAAQAGISAKRSIDVLPRTHPTDGAHALRRHRCDTCGTGTVAMNVLHPPRCPVDDGPFVFLGRWGLLGEGGQLAMPPPPRSVVKGSVRDGQTG